MNGKHFTRVQRHLFLSYAGKLEHLSNERRLLFDADDADNIHTVA